MGTQCMYAALLFRAVIWIAFLKKEQSPLANRMCAESFFLLAMLRQYWRVWKQRKLHIQ